MVKGRRGNGEGKLLAYRNEIKRPRHGTSILRWSVLAIIAVLGGCVGLAPPVETEGGGINLEYLFGARRPAEPTDTSLIDDPEYVEYLEWKRWQDFQAYQEWKRRQEE